MNRLRTISASAVLASLVPAQQLVWAEGSAPGAVSVLALDEQNPTAGATVLRTGLELVPIEITGRTAQQSLQTRDARRVVRQGVSRVELPSGGNLFAFRTNGGATWGYLLVRGDGSVHTLLERPGGGLTMRDNPFADRIGVAPDGRHAAVATALGQVFVVRLDGQSFASTGVAWRPIALPALVEPLSLMPGASVLFCVTEDARFWRTPLADGGTAVDVTPTAVPGMDLKDELALAGDGRSAVFLYGPKPSYSLYLVRETGAATRLPPPPAKYEEPGYLPETPDGPRLLLDDNASRLLYVDATIRDEVFLLDTSGATPTTHLTSDPNFQPYIGILILPVFVGGVVTGGIGNPGAFDLYRASTAQPNVTNLTRTAGNTTAPFAAGGILPRNVSPVGQGDLLAEVVNGTGVELWRVGSGGTTALRAGLSGPLLRGSGLGSVTDYLARSPAGDLMIAAADGSPLVQAPAGVRLSTSVSARGDAFRMFEASIGAARALIFRLRDGSLVGVSIDPQTRENALTSGGNLAISAGALAFVSRAGVFQAAPAAAFRVVLSGRVTE